MVKQRKLWIDWNKLYLLCNCPKNIKARFW